MFYLAIAILNTEDGWLNGDRSAARRNGRTTRAPQDHGGLVAAGPAQQRGWVERADQQHQPDQRALPRVAAAAAACRRHCRRQRNARLSTLASSLRHHAGRGERSQRGGGWPGVPVRGGPCHALQSQVCVRAACGGTCRSPLPVLCCCYCCCAPTAAGKPCRVALQECLLLAVRRASLESKAASAGCSLLVTSHPAPPLARLPAAPLIGSTLCGTPLVCTSWRCS